MASKFKSVSRNQIKTTITSATTTTTSKTLIRPKTKTKLQTDTMSEKITKAATIATRTTTTLAKTVATTMPKKPLTIMTGATQNSVANKFNTNKSKSLTITTTNSTVKSASTLTRSIPNANTKMKTATTTTTTKTPKKKLAYISTTAGTCNTHTDWRLPRKSSVFAYDLSKDEQNCFLHRQFNSPMKSVPDAEIQLLRNGLRQSYLTQRYERTPDDKYNYPEATSWRYGWFHKAWRDGYHRPCTIARAHGADENRICRGIVTTIERPNGERTISRHKNAAKAFWEGVNYRGHKNDHTSIVSNKSKATLVGYALRKDIGGSGRR